METLFETVKYILFGFFGLILLLVVITILFGKRIRKQWEFEADFRDANGREFGEFEVELPVETEGRTYVQRAQLVNPVDRVSAGQNCRVVVGGSEIASAEFHPD